MKPIEQPSSFDLIERVRSRSGHLSPSFRKLAEYVLANMQDVAFSSAAEVGRAAGVSESVVVRFAGSLEYPGYPALQQAAQSFVRSQLGPAARFEAIPLTASSSFADVLTSAALQDITNLERMRDYPANLNTFPKVIELFLRAERVFISGVRGLRHLAGLLAFLLDIAGLETVLVIQGDVEGFQLLSHIGKGDVFVAFGFARYPRTATQFVKTARQMGADTVVICDSLLAPPAKAAHHALLVPTECQGFHNSYVSAVSCINAILVSLSINARARAKRRLREIDSVVPEDYFEGLDSQVAGSYRVPKSKAR